MSVVVAGGGLGGLTTALALARRGCAVTVVERAPALSEAGAGVQLSPNATRVLRRLGVLDRIAPGATRPDEVRIRRFRDGDTIARVPLGDAAERRYGAPFLLAHRADVQAALLGAVGQEPLIALALGESVTDFTVADTAVRLTLQAGGDGHRAIEAAGLVGADGLRSLVRVRLGDTALPRFSGRLAWRALVPARDAPAMAGQAASQLWLGPHAHLVHYPVRGGTLVNVVAIVDGAPEAGAEDWARPGDGATLLARFSGWDRQAHALLAAAESWRVWPLFDRPALPRWSAGPVTLLGDAAHPMLPFLAQGAAQAIEDAGALGEAWSAARPFAAVALAYERRRRPRATRVQRDSARQGAVYHLTGAFALARDTTMRLLGPERMAARYDWLYAPQDPMAT